MSEFQMFPKIYRLNREILVTEKIDGTNGQIHIEPGYSGSPDVIHSWFDEAEKTDMVMYAGSRTRWITPLKDNFGFAKWVKENAVELQKLGAGTHNGEWWGEGIQRGYGVPKTFSLFDTRWSEPEANRPVCCSVVPVLYRGVFDQQAINSCIEALRESGSIAAPGFMNPEGIVIFHTQGRFGLKVTLKNDEKPKGSNDQA